MRTMAGSGVVYETRRKMQTIAARIFPFEMMDKIYTKIICGYVPNLDDPKTFNEKVQWLKLNYFTKDSKVADMADKVKVHSILKEKNMNDILPRLLFVCDKTED